jgi:penicillin-binding protein 1A
MDDPFEPRKSRSPKPRSFRASRLLEIDAWIDSTLYDGSFRAREFWENLTIFFRRFRVTGWKRAVVELLGETATMGAAGSVVLLALAMPAFEDTARDWRSQGDFAVTFLDRYGAEIGQRGIIQRDSVPVDEMPDFVVKAVLATEDRRFFDHYGIDFLGLTRAMSENVRANSVVQGGSTITQQLAKNLFLSNERTIERKIKDVTLAEAAMLAGLFKAPAKYAPHINLPAARGRANEVLTNMVQAGYMTEGQVLSARLHPADVVDRGDLKSPDYFLDWAFEEAKKLGDKYHVRSMVARTTIDMNLQRAAEETLEYHLRQFGKDYGVSEGAIVMLDTAGAVRAIVGGRDYGQSQFNRATKALRQAGSSFKPYVYAVAMEHGFSPDSTISDGPINWGGWQPKNYGRSYSGKVTLSSALIRSINTVPVRLAKESLGIEPIVEMAKAMGVESPLNGHKTMVLGTSGMTVMDQATGYLVFADGGYGGERHGITQLLNHSGKVIYDYSRDAPAPRRVLSEQAVAKMNSMLVQVPEHGTGRRAALPGIRSAGKTGTTQAYRDAWYVGFTGNYVAAVWLGNDDYTETNRLTGGSLPAMTWQRLMEYAHENIDLKPIPGIEKPFLDEKTIAKADVKNGQENDVQSVERPPMLSTSTTQYLRALGDLFQQSPILDTPPAPETLSAL